MTFFRGRRLRKTQSLRDIVQETWLRPEDLVQPYFVVETSDKNFSKEITSMPGQFQLSLFKLEEKVTKAVDNGLKSVILFGIPEKKDEIASEAYNPKGIVQQAVHKLKRKFPDLVVITDVCLCEYTSHGHCGIIEDRHVQNDPTLKLLAKTALSHVKAGADIVAPSDMMDGRVKAIREILDKHGFIETPIMSYAVKYASSFYGPFREAAESTPQFGDRKSYQMNPANSNEAILEAKADFTEGADIIMVKPALPYLDILQRLKDSLFCPLAAYQVSGEYAQIKAASLNGWIDEKNVVLESLISIKRAGANLIISYFTEQVLKWL
ncbi:porphobilinogen synthase [Desulfonauticus submarinus]|uniref:Delta-aminolevulinic acid dehydratase n=1 Tax=Desulfonauticus submarinus TaxID=206665 RepID=A0A1H0DGS2_9BACT|nr:porphobilinogen synthase [Desulfonauticus submarinus]SDN69226.1 porphobilinogen synthase [Desulfonauticus submarinus]